MSFVSYPASTWLSCQKLRMSSADPTSRTSADAVCTTTSASRVRLLRPTMPRPACWRLPRREPEKRKAGSRPNAHAASTEMPAVKSSAVRSRPRGGESGNGCAAKAAGDRIRRRADQERDAGPRDERADRASRGREKQRLGHLRAHQIASSGAERAAHHQVAAPVLRPHREQVGDVRARDEEDDADRAEQNPQRRRDPADQLLAERLHHRPVTLHDPHVRRRAAQPLLHATRERFELRHERCAVRSRRHARDHARPEPARRDLRGANRHRDPERDALIREAELRLHDADHRRESGPRRCSSCRSPPDRS